MFRRFFRSFFWSVLVGFVVAWMYVGVVRASNREAVLVEDRDEGVVAVLGPGEWGFFYQRIQPGEVTLHPVQLERVLRFEYQRPLDQTELLGLDEDFYVRADLRLDYRLDPQRLEALFERLRHPDWRGLEEYVRLRLDYFLDRKFQDLFPDLDNELPGVRERLYAYWSDEAIQDLNAEFAADGLVFRQALPAELHVPDPQGYADMVARRGEILAEKRDRIKLVDDARARRTAQKIEDEAYYERLEQVGQLLRRHPQLSEYLPVDRLGKNVDVLVVPYERWSGAPAVSPDALLEGSTGSSGAYTREPGYRFPQRGDGAGLQERRGAPPEEYRGNGGEFVDLTPP